MGDMRTGIILLAAVILPGCTTQTAQQDYAVRVSYAYDASGDKAASAWRAWMSALDQCHDEGYQDAYPAGGATQCDRSSDGACVHFLVKASYDCVGLGYQAN
jgi:hypothetical protein